MPLLTYNFPFHTVETTYPESSARIKFGGGYEFASQPTAPDQLTYTLHYQGMAFFVTTGVVDRLVNPTRNMATLEDFYKVHRQATKFTYVHPSDGSVTVRFKNPLRFKVAPGGLGTVDPFTVELITQP